MIIIRKELKCKSKLFNRNGRSHKYADLDYSGFDILLPGNVPTEKGILPGGSVALNFWHKLANFKHSVLTKDRSNKITTDSQLKQTQGYAKFDFVLNAVGLEEYNDILLEAGMPRYPQDYYEVSQAFDWHKLNIVNSLSDTTYDETVLMTEEKGISDEDESSDMGVIVMRNEEYVEAFLPGLDEWLKYVSLEHQSSSIDINTQWNMQTIQDVPLLNYPTVVCISLRAMDGGVLLENGSLYTLSYEDFKLYTAVGCKRNIFKKLDVHEHNVPCGYVSSGKVSHLRGCNSIGIGGVSATILFKYMVLLQIYQHQLELPYASYIMLFQNPNSKYYKVVHFEVNM